MNFFPEEYDAGASLAKHTWRDNSTPKHAF